MKRHRLRPITFGSNDKPGLTMTYFTARSNFATYAFTWEYVAMMDSLEIISSPEPKAHGELIVYQSSRRHWVGGKDALGFGPDRIRTLVSMVTDSSHRVILGKML